jgi:hypothetical protein
MDLTISAKMVTTDANNYKEIDVEIHGADAAEILNHFSIRDIVSHFEAAALLDEIGEGAAIKHFDIQTQD